MNVTELIKQHEGLSLKVYKCPADRWTIGSSPIQLYASVLYEFCGLSWPKHLKDLPCLAYHRAENCDCGSCEPVLLKALRCDVSRRKTSVAEIAFHVSQHQPDSVGVYPNEGFPAGCRVNHHCGAGIPIPADMDKQTPRGQVYAL